MKTNRRDFLAGIGSLSAGLILSGCVNANRISQKEKEAKDGEGYGHRRFDARAWGSASGTICV